VDVSESEPTGVSRWHVDEETARKVTGVLRDCATTLAQSSDEVKKLAPEPAWAPYRIIVAETMGVLYADMLGEIWREHPSLEPKGEEGVSYYHPERLQMPREAAEIVLRATADAKRRFQEVQGLLGDGPIGSAQDRYKHVIVAVLSRLDVVARRCKRQHPDLQ
jgi:hypothetical protein